MLTAGAAAELYPDLQDGTYDCVDRIVLRAYFRFIQDPAGFRLWWRRWQGSDDQLNNARLMRIAGHFSRRLKAWAAQAGVPVIFSAAGERKETVSAAHLPKDPAFTGVFLVVVGRAPGNVWDVQHTADGRIRSIRRKHPRPWVNHYAFHIWDREWGHLIVRFCPHPPFNALIVLNGHEWVAAEAARCQLGYRKEDNCFTDWSDAAGLGQIAETLSSPSSEGRLLQVCERWIYSAVLCFALDIADQERTDFCYSYSVFQAEYSRNLRFRIGGEMEQVFQRLIDRVRGHLQLKTICTLFGRRQRPRRRKGSPQEPNVEIVLERPAYDLIIFRVHFDRLTLKIYTKGERVLRIEAMAHNTRDLRCGTSLERYPLIIAALRQMVDRFSDVLDCVDAAFIEPGLLDTLPAPSQVGRARVGGVDLNKARMRAVVESVLALSPIPRGFSASDVAERVRACIGDTHYTTTRAAYDLRKLRGKGLLSKLPQSRRYHACPQALRALAALLILREHVMRPLFAGALGRQVTHEPRHLAPLDERYGILRQDMNDLFREIGIAA